MIEEFDHEAKFKHVTRQKLRVGQESRVRDKIRQKYYEEAEDRRYMKDHVKKLESETKLAEGFKSLYLER